MIKIALGPEKKARLLKIKSYETFKKDGKRNITYIIVFVVHSILSEFVRYFIFLNR